MELELPDVITTSTYGYDALRSLVTSGELVRVRTGAYLGATDQPAPWWEQKATTHLAICVAVAQKFTTGFAFTHESSAAIRGWVDTVGDDVAHLTQTVNPGRAPTPGVVRHVCDSIDELGIEWIGPLPVAGVDRTILDCARLLPPDRALAAVDGAFRVEAAMSKFERVGSQVRQEAIRRRVLDRLQELGPARGVRQARVILQHADGFAENGGESRMRWVALQGGLPAPVCQYEIWVDGRQYFADATWFVEQEGAQIPVIAEFDGEKKYRGAAGADAVVDEKRREDAIRRRTDARFVRLDTATVGRADRAFAEMMAAFPAGGAPRLAPRRELLVRAHPRSRRPRS